MRLATLRRPRKNHGLPGLVGVARVGRNQRHGDHLSARDLAKRLKPGDIAVIDHLDLDQVTAQLLVASGVSAIVNAAPSSSGRYPNLGPDIVVAGGVILLDRVGAEAIRGIDDGEKLRLDGSTLYRGEVAVARGDLLTPDTVCAAMDRARDGLAFQLQVFASNASEHLRQERDLLLDGAGFPELRTQLDGRPVVVVVDGADWRADLEGLRHYIREVAPVLVGVDEGADALIEAGYQPDVIIGDLDSVSDVALTSGAELVLHVERDGSAPGYARLEEMGAQYTVFQAMGTGEDLALLLADASGAQLIVLAGSHATLTEFIDHARSEMAGAFLARLRVGSKLVDARSIATVYRRRMPVWPLFVLLMLAVAALAGAIALTGTQGFDGTVLGDWWDSSVAWVRELR
ncbi:MAG: hypothetical protein QOH75_1682 [Actinomycetota bacterium]|nr:hypothetical protein [Actinomycetota bacterium]